MSRLDLFLKNAGLFKQRSQARRACDEGRVRLEGRALKAGWSVEVGKVLCIEVGERRVEAEILAIPPCALPREERAHYCRILQRARRSREAALSFDEDLDAGGF